MYDRKLIDKIIIYERDGTIPAGSDSAQRRWVSHYNSDFTAKDQKLLYKEKPVVAAEDADTVLQRLYNDPSTTCNGRDRFFHRVQTLYAGVSKTYIMNFLKLQTTYQLHKAIPCGNKVTDIASQNSNSNWILNIIDCFSKYLWSYKLKYKTGRDVAKCIKEWINNLPAKCETLQTDNGTEFLNNEAKAVLEADGIKHITGPTYTPQSQGQVMRTNGTLKRLLYATMTTANTKRWIDLLPKCVSNHNNTLHTTIKTKPAQLFAASRRGQLAAHHIKRGYYSAFIYNSSYTEYLLPVNSL